MKKRIVSFVMVIMMLLSGVSTPENVQAESAQNVIINKINAYVSGLNGWYNTSYQNGREKECAAFVNEVWANVFGFDWWASDKISKIDGGWTSNSAFISFLNSHARPGDIIWGKNWHNMILMGWDSNGIRISDGMSNGKIWHNNGYVSFSGNEWSGYYKGYFSTGYRLYHINDNVYNSFATSSNLVTLWGIENNDTYSGMKQLWAKRFDGDSNHYAVFYVDNQAVTGHLSSDASGYFSFWLDTTQYSNGSHSLRVEYVNSNGLYRSEKTIIISNIDKEAPSISNVSVTDKNPNGYTVSCTVSDNIRVKDVQFATFTYENGQDDWIWDKVTKTGNRYSCIVKTNEHNDEIGRYITRIYATDDAGNLAVLKGADLYVENTKPVISDVKIVEVTPDGYIVQCTADDASGIKTVKFPTWTEANGQDDILWDAYTKKESNTYFYEVKCAQHNYEISRYITHVYAYDNWGNESSVGPLIVNVLGDQQDIGTDFVASIKNSQTQTVLTEGIEHAYGNITGNRYTGSNNQLWFFTRNDNGTYRIQSLASMDKSLAASGVNEAKSTTIRTQKSNDSDDQQWKVYENDGAYIFVPASSDSKSINLNYASAKEDTIVHLYPVSSSSGRKYIIEKKDVAISLSTSSLNLKPGDTAKIEAQVENDFFQKGITWTSSDESIASVSDGVVTAKADGTVTITATSLKDATRSAACTVTVETERPSPTPVVIPSFQTEDDEDVEDVPAEGENLTKGKMAYKVTGFMETLELVSTTSKDAVKLTIPTKVTIDDIDYYVTSIGDNALENCTKLTSITIGKKVKYIGKHAFSGCKRLRTINIKTKLLKEKSVGKNVFKGISAKATIKVPSGKCYKTYKKLLKGKGQKKTVKIKASNKW